MAKFINITEGEAANIKTIVNIEAIKYIIVKDSKLFLCFGKEDMITIEFSDNEQRDNALNKITEQSND